MQDSTTPFQSPGWLQATALGVVLRVFIQPKASKSEITGEYGEGHLVRLKIRIAAPPVEGLANEAVLIFLRDVTGLPASRVKIIRGENSRTKDVLCLGAKVKDIFEALRISHAREV